ncbi:MAG: hypothetical protein R3B91_13680 [Planctomycetaceae bacterium]
MNRRHRRLIDEGFRVSIDSFDRTEVEAAVKCRREELVLSCNNSNIEWAQQLDAELVVIRMIRMIFRHWKSPLID